MRSFNFQLQNWPSNTKKKKEGKIRTKKKKERLITYFMRNKNILVRVDVKWRKKYYCVANGFWKERNRCMRDTTKTRIVLIYVYFLNIIFHINFKRDYYSKLKGIISDLFLYPLNKLNFI